MSDLYSHSIIDPVPLTEHLERVVCDCCGSDSSRVLAVLPPVEALPNPAHRLGGSALDLGGHSIRFVKCRACGLVYMNPRLTEAAIARFYDTIYRVPGAFPHFDGYATGRVGYLLDMTARFLKASTPSVLDIGCGGGQFLRAAQARGWLVAGTELSRVAAERASEVLGVPIHLGDFREAGFAAGSLDVVTMQSLVEHVRTPIDFLRDAGTLLRSGGLLVFNVPNANSWEYRFSRLLGRRWRGFIIEHLYYFTPALVQSVLGDLGFDLLHISSRNPASRFPNPLRDIIQMRRSQSGADAPEGSVPPLPTGLPPPLVVRVARQAGNYTLDIVSKLSESRRTAGNSLFVWARKAAVS